MTPNNRLLLISSSFVHGKGYLEHCKDAIKQRLDFGPGKKVMFIPYAMKDLDWYYGAAEPAFSEMGYKLVSAHHYDNPAEAIASDDIGAIFVGGGNTPRLLTHLYKLNLLQAIKQKVSGGVPYVATSAGINVACPTIRTTNDWYIMTPPSLDALGLVDFQINAHFVSGSLTPTHMGETRETRIKEYHEENNLPVVGLPELSWITADNGQCRLGGGTDATVFLSTGETRPWRVGETLQL